MTDSKGEKLFDTLIVYFMSGFMGYGVYEFMGGYIEAPGDTLYAIMVTAVASSILTMWIMNNHRGG